MLAETQTTETMGMNATAIIDAANESITHNVITHVHADHDTAIDVLSGMAVEEGLDFDYSQNGTTLEFWAFEESSPDASSFRVHVELA